MSNLKKARERKNLTQEQVATAVGISNRCYQYYESSDRLPNVRTAILIAKELGMNVEELWKNSPT